MNLSLVFICNLLFVYSAIYSDIKLQQAKDLYEHALINFEHAESRFQNLEREYIRLRDKKNHSSIICEQARLSRLAAENAFSQCSSMKNLDEYKKSKNHRDSEDARYSRLMADLSSVNSNFDSAKSSYESYKMTYNFSKTFLDEKKRQYNALK